MKGGGTDYELTNYACCLALQGNIDEEMVYLTAFELLNGNERHDNIYLAKAILFKLSGDDLSAKRYFDSFRKFRRFLFYNFYNRYKGSVILKDLEKRYLDVEVQQT